MSGSNVRGTVRRGPPPASTLLNHRRCVDPRPNAHPFSNANVQTFERETLEEMEGLGCQLARVVRSAQVVAGGCHDACSTRRGGGREGGRRVHGFTAGSHGIPRWPRDSRGVLLRYTAVNKNVIRKDFSTIFAPSRCKSLDLDTLRASRDPHRPFPRFRRLAC